MQASHGINDPFFGPSSTDVHPWFCAVKHNNHTAVEGFLSLGQDIHEVDPVPGWNALQVAAFFGHVELAQWLATRGLALDVVDNEGDSLMHLAVCSQKPAMVRWLLDRGVSPNGYQDCDDPPLYRAAQQGLMEIAQLLIDYGANVNAVRLSRHTILSTATKNPAMLRLLLRSGADPTQLSHCAFFWALSYGAPLSVIRLLAAFVSNINQPNPEGATPLMCAASGCPKAIGLLVKMGACLEQEHERFGTTALWDACAAGRLESAMALRALGASLDPLMGNSSALLSVAMSDHKIAIIRWLLDQGLDPVAATDQGITPLHIAARNGAVEVIALLMAQGADPHAPAENGATPRTVNTNPLVQSQLSACELKRSTPKSQPEGIVGRL